MKQDTIRPESMSDLEKNSPKMVLATKFILVRWRHRDVYVKKTTATKRKKQQHREIHEIDNDDAETDREIASIEAQSTPALDWV